MSETIQIPSRPYLCSFNPEAVPKQLGLIADIRRKFDYSKGSHEVLLSGGVGNGKSLLLSHIVVTHCIQNPGARVCLGRRTIPDVKATILREVLEHISEDLVEGRDYEHNKSNGEIKFSNGSEISCRSWADGKSKKSRSLKFSMLVVEEITENDENDFKAIMELRMRIGRVESFKNKENLFIAACNPDEPTHSVYKYFYDSGLETRHVYEFSPFDNPFLPDWYLTQLKGEMDPKTARRMLYGEWLALDTSNIYHAYSRDVNFRDIQYSIINHLPIGLAFDFNIGEGKPMSCALLQYDASRDTIHVFDQSVIHGARTNDVLEDIAARGLLDHPCEYWVFGDATGKARSTKSLHSDYEIIEKFLSNYVTRDGRRLNYVMKVPSSNPPIRKRHNVMNGYFKNELGKHRCFIYRDAKTADEGFRLTALKNGGNYIEEDSNAYQHITTAIGYAAVYLTNAKATGGPRMLKR